MPPPSLAELPEIVLSRNVAVDAAPPVMTTAPPEVLALFADSLLYSTRKNFSARPAPPIPKPVGFVFPEMLHRRRTSLDVAPTREMAPPDVSELLDRNSQSVAVSEPPN